MIRNCLKSSAMDAPRRATALACITGSVIAVASSGCGQAAPERVAVYPVAGTITFRGQPAHGAIVTLHPKSGPVESVPTPRANVGPDGAFQITTFDGGDGAPAGEYIVTVKWYKPVRNGPDVVAGPNVIPRKYAAPETSDKIVTVAAGPNDLQAIKL